MSAEQRCVIWTRGTATGRFVVGGGDMPGLPSGALAGVQALFEPWALVEIDVTAVLD